MKLHPHISLLLIPVHVIFIVSLFYINFNLTLLLSIFLLWIVLGGMGLEIGFHRSLSHMQYNIHPVYEKFLCFLGCFTMNGSPIFWRAMHNGYHHPHPETHRDFHTPKFKGKFFAYVGYIQTLHKIKYIGCRHLLSDRFHTFLDKFYIFVIWATVALVFLISFPAGFVFVTTMIICFHQTALINILCHGSNLGYRNYETRDESRNIKWFSFFTFGQGLHNNHHYKPNAFNCAMKPGELDIGYTLSKLIGLTINRNIKEK